MAGSRVKGVTCDKEGIVMSNAVLDVRDVPDLLISRFHSNAISWREENGALLFEPAKEDPSLDMRRSALEELKKFGSSLFHVGASHFSPAVSI
jgi:hypothetical protein